MVGGALCAGGGCGLGQRSWRASARPPLRPPKAAALAAGEQQEQLQRRLRFTQRRRPQHLDSQKHALSRALPLRTPWPLAGCSSVMTAAATPAPAPAPAAPAATSGYGPRPTEAGERASGDCCGAWRSRARALLRRDGGRDGKPGTRCGAVRRCAHLPPKAS